MQQHLLKTKDNAVVIFGSSFPNDHGQALCSHRTRITTTPLNSRSGFLAFNLDFQLVLLRSVPNSKHVFHIPASEDISVIMVTRFINRVVLLYMKDLLIYKLTKVEFILFQEENIFL